MLLLKELKWVANGKRRRGGVEVVVVGEEGGRNSREAGRTLLLRG